MKKSILFRLFLWIGVLLSLTACEKTTDDLYARERAFLRFSPVTAVHPLHSALNNPGMWCTIKVGAKTYDFINAEGRSATYPRVADEVYGRPECISGYLVGTPSVPDMNMQFLPVAYELACPNCYEQAMVQVALDFSGLEEMGCPRCDRRYDLTNGGIVSSSEGGKRLYRYRLTYANDMLVVMN